MYQWKNGDDLHRHVCELRIGSTNLSLLEEDAGFEENRRTSESDVTSPDQDIEVDDEQTHSGASGSEIGIPLDQDADSSISSVFYDSMTMF